MALAGRSEALLYADSHGANGLNRIKPLARITAITETPDGQALGMERCVPADRPHGALPAQITGYIRP